ncbi:MAG: EF-P lysine aminoacylase GenX [Victivallaceae bacterium]|nr:EF-P lysine aminoacylase GenX [Victivallaceae bacterium]
MNNIAQLENIKARLTSRAGLLRSLRSFFDNHGFIEVNTPTVISAPAPEEFIEAPQTGDKFLRTSPELEMKCLLAAGYEKIYQIGSCFRAGEYGKRHRPEFTMLEWYETKADYNQLLDFTAAMLKTAVHELCGSTKINYSSHCIDFSLTPETITVNDAYKKFAGISVEQAIEQNIFDEIMVDQIEPNLGLDRMTFLKDYPADRAALAKLNESNGHCYAERWELYLGGLEIANAYSELTDIDEQHQRFTTAARQRQKNGLSPYPEANDFFAAMEHGLPESSGCALGIDRLLMAITDADDIAQTCFPN